MHPYGVHAPLTLLLICSDSFLGSDPRYTARNMCIRSDTTQHNAMCTCMPVSDSNRGQSGTLWSQKTASRSNPVLLNPSLSPATDPHRHLTHTLHCSCSCSRSCMPPSKVPSALFPRNRKQSIIPLVTCTLHPRDVRGTPTQQYPHALPLSS